jgi:hypothetical protein
VDPLLQVKSMPTQYIVRRATALPATAKANAAPIYIDSDDNILKYIPAGTGTTEVQILDASSSQTLVNKTLTLPTITSPSISSPVVTGDAGTGTIFSKTVLFSEDAASLTHTGTVVIPAGATLLDILVVPEVLWANTGGTALFTCGDAGAATGWFTAVDLKATDLVLGERLQASNANNWGGKNGAYLTTAGRFGQQSANMIGGYCPSVYSVIGVVTCVAPASTAGRTRMTVLWTLGQAVAPVKA